MTYEDVIKIPERNRTSAQQRIVAEWEWERAQKAAQQSKQAIVQTIVNSAHDAVLFEAFERYLVAISHIECAAGPYDPKVALRDDYITFAQFKAMPAKDRDELIHVTNLYFENHGLSWTV